MIEDTIAKIEARLRTAESLSPERRAELEQLLADLRLEAMGHPVLGRSAGGSSVEGEEDARSAVDRLQASVAEFETTHPKLTGLVNRISIVLANMGI